MWYRRETLLAAVIFTALCYKVTAVKELGMALEAVDDLYNGCDEQAMGTLIRSGLLYQELNRSEGFQTAWSTKCSTLIPGGVKEHTAALMAYANGDTKFKKAFNDAVETMGGNLSTYENNFHFKSLHFLLIDSMKRLRQQKCKNVYRVSNKEYKAQNGSKVRFGRFTTVQTETSMQEDVTEGTLFNITTCFFVSLGDICDNGGDKAIISPIEEFTVVDVKEKGSDDDTYTEITLHHSRLASLHNCYTLSRSPANVSTQWLVLVLAGFSLFFINCRA